MPKNLLILESQIYVASVNFRNYLYILSCLYIIIIIINEFSQVSISISTLAIPYISKPPFTYACHNSTRHKPFGVHAANISSGTMLVTNRCGNTESYYCVWGGVISNTYVTRLWTKHKKSYVYLNVHHLDSWIKTDQLDVTRFIISPFTAQHFFNVSTSIFRSLRLIVGLFHVLYCSVRIEVFCISVHV